MHKDTNLSIYELDALFDLIPGEGRLIWRNQPIDVFEGYSDYPVVIGRDVAYSINPQTGRLKFGLNGAERYVHRIVWSIYNFEEIGIRHIEHINGNITDNRAWNLRAVTPSENAKNRALRKNNKYGCHGIRKSENGKRWVAVITYGGQLHHIGTFDQLEDAIAARKAAEQRYGFHKNHGRSTNIQPRWLYGDCIGV